MQTSSLGRKEMSIGTTGNAVTLGAGFVGWVASTMPVLQAFSLLVSIVVGVLTAIWWIRKLRKEK
jgi:predicted RND superfamily exporter protein